MLSQADDGCLEVEDMRDDAKGAPLLAKASGAVRVGDVVVAINDRVLARHGEAPSLAEAAEELKAAPRPVRFLFKRRGASASLD